MVFRHTGRPPTGAADQPVTGTGRFGTGPSPTGPPGAFTCGHCPRAVVQGQDRVGPDEKAARVMTGMDGTGRS